MGRTVMKKISEGDVVRVNSINRTGIVIEITKKIALVEFYDESMVSEDEYSFDIDELEVVQAPTLKMSQLKAFIRGEITLKEISNGSNIIDVLIDKDQEESGITIDDLFVGVKKYMNVDDYSDVYAWISTFMDKEEDFNLNCPYDYVRKGISEYDIYNVIWEYLDDIRWDLLDECDYEFIETNFKHVYEVLDNWINKKEYPEQVIHNIFAEFNEDSFDKVNEETKQLYKTVLEKLCDKDDPKAIQKRGYCYYTGNSVYPNDWYKARDSFIKYYEMTGDASAANTLGYIYYYGRCNEGVPEYEEAFKYFSIGHAFGYYESTYKIADMFKNGYGVVKSGETANRLYWKVYNETFEDFVNGKFDGKFADAALRIGNCYRDGIGCDSNKFWAYYYYLQADYAIRKRIEYNHYGDTVVYNGIQKALTAAKEAFLEDYKETYTIKEKVPRKLYRVLFEHRKGILSFKELSDGNLSLRVRTEKHYDEEKAPKILLTECEAGYCELVNEIKLKTYGLEEYDFNDAKSFVTYDTVDFSYDKDGRPVTTLLLDKKVVGRIICEEYKITLKKKTSEKSGEEYTVVSVRFEGTGRVYDYLSHSENVNPGDIVTINGYNGETQVEVVAVNKKAESELGLPVVRYKWIVKD